MKADKPIEILRAYRVPCMLCGKNIVVVVEKGERIPKLAGSEKRVCEKCGEKEWTRFRHITGDVQ